jgi:iron complex transport system substrate-binding protein
MQRLRILAVAAALVVVAAACGDDDTDDAADTPTETAAANAAADTTAAGDTDATADPAADAVFPVTIDAASGPVTLTARPERIVSLSATATEMLFAVDAGEQVVAVDEFSTYPPEAPVTDLSGFTPNIEAISAHDPDLVVSSNGDAELVDGLGALKIPVLVLPAAVTLDDSYAQIEQLGVATGHVAEAAEVVATMQSQLEELAASITQPDEPLTYYHELDTTYFSVTSQTFLGEVYAMLGLENIADPADEDASGYPQLSAEFIIEQDPDLIFLADAKCCGQDLAAVSQRPGWGSLTAVQQGAVVALDDDIASRWGPRTPDLLEAVAEAVEQLTAGAASDGGPDGASGSGTTATTTASR